MHHTWKKFRFSEDFPLSSARQLHLSRAKIIRFSSHSILETSPKIGCDLSFPDGNTYISPGAGLHDPCGKRNFAKYLFFFLSPYFTRHACLFFLSLLRALNKITFFSVFVPLFFFFFRTQEFLLFFERSRRGLLAPTRFEGTYPSLLHTSSVSNFTLKHRKFWKE